MSKQNGLKQINERYSGLAASTCCLSCGGALDLADVKPGETCVDLGSGRGLDVIRMAEAAGASGFAYGIDTADGMLAQAKRTAKKMSVPNVEFIKSSFEQIRLDNHICDLVISNCSINHAEDKFAVWKEVYRILKPGGRFVVSDIYSLEEVPEVYRNDPAAVSECWAGAVTRVEYMTTLEHAGFSQITILEESAPYDKGQIQVASFTVAGLKPGGCCC